MKFASVFFLFVSLALQTGCAGKPFQPPPFEFESWEKPGTSEQEIKRALLECGYPDPFIAGGKASANEFVIMSRCMEKSGFTSKIPYSLCRGNFNLPACALPDAEIPNRKIEKRLGGRFCRELPGADVCK
ncbi:hypothetical protein ACQ858_07015 [Variovorax ureilyticus]|uniref:hypothetical protein n=1 Tax=Variovorax ureilyticus TaxID=1836198 RepID=UPI003D665862